MDVERGARPQVAELEEVVGAGLAGTGSAPLASPTGPPGRRRGPGPATRAALLVGGLAAAIVATGLLGPRPPSPPDAGPTDPPFREAVVSTPAPALPTEPIPALRRSGTPLPDPYALVAGRWMDLGTGRPVEGAPRACAGRLVHVLAGGRIVCVTSDVTRSPGSRLALYDLGVATVGQLRAAPDAAPAAGAPTGLAARQPLGTLLGQRDVVIGDPVAIAVAPGPGPDELVIAWAAVNAGVFEIGLEAYRLGRAGERAERIGDWILGRAPSTGRDAVETLGDLAVAVRAGDGVTALVGWTEAGRGVAGPVRRLVVVPLDEPGAPVRLPPAATRNLPPEAADGPLRTGTPCGGPLGEGLASDTTAYVVCPGTSAEIRLLDVGQRGGDGWPGAVVGTARLEPAVPAAGSAWLAGYGAAVDVSRGILYRWSPVAATIWRIELDGGTGGGPRVTALPLLARDAGGDAGSVPAAGEDAVPAGPLPTLVLDAAGDRLFALDAPLRGSGRAVVHLVDLASWAHVASFPVADRDTRAISLSPDGALLYASTAPRRSGSEPPVVGVAVLDARTGLERAYAGRLLVGPGGPLQPVVVR